MKKLLLAFLIFLACDISKRIFDVLGRETKEIKHSLLFYLSNDGTVEKRIVIE